MQESDEIQREPIWVEFDPAKASFPSDQLSIERLRRAFPESFDADDTIIDGYSQCNFFYPAGLEDPPHLVRLDHMLSDERMVAHGACVTAQDASSLAEQEGEFVAESAKRLVDHYLYFGLADNPHRANTLVRQVEEQGQLQARGRSSRQR